MKVGLKFGALPILRRKQAMLVTQKVMRYVIVTILAMVLTSANKVNCARRKVKRIPIVGSSLSKLPCPNIDSPGKMLSRASACKDFADPMTPMRAEKNEVANSPIKIKCGEILI